MYKIILMEADYEPWWQFDDMKEHFKEVLTFEDYTIYETQALHILSQFEQTYDFLEQREHRFYAFWNEGEIVYCEGCDEDLQKYYGVILSHPVKEYVK